MFGLDAALRSRTQFGQKGKSARRTVQESLITILVAFIQTRQAPVSFVLECARLYIRESDRYLSQENCENEASELQAKNLQRDTSLS